MRPRQPYFSQSRTRIEPNGYDRDPTRRKSTQDREQDIARRRAYQMQALEKLKKQ